jgi:hypothetical protein
MPKMTHFYRQNAFLSNRPLHGNMSMLKSRKQADIVAFFQRITKVKLGPRNERSIGLEFDEI